MTGESVTLLTRSNFEAIFKKEKALASSLYEKPTYSVEVAVMQLSLRLQGTQVPEVQLLKKLILGSTTYSSLILWVHMLMILTFI